MPLPPHLRRRGPALGSTPTHTLAGGAYLRLAHLTAEEAWTVSAILEDFLDAIWRVHGDAMADYQGRVFPDLPAPLDACPYRSDHGRAGNNGTSEPF